MKRVIVSLVGLGLIVMLMQASMALAVVLVLLAIAINLVIRPRQTAEAIFGLAMFSLMLHRPWIFVGLLVLAWVIRIIGGLLE